MNKSVKICSMFRGKRTNRMISIVKEIPENGEIGPNVVQSGKEAEAQLIEPVRFRGWFWVDNNEA